MSRKFGGKSVIAWAAFGTKKKSEMCSRQINKMQQGTKICWKSICGKRK